MNNNEIEKKQEKPTKYPLGYKASALKQTPSTKYHGLTLLDERIIDTIQDGNNIYKTSKLLDISYHTVKKRIATNFDLRQHLAGEIQLSEDYVNDQLLDELHRIAMTAKSDGIRIKAIAEYLKVLRGIKSVVEVNTRFSNVPQNQADVEELLKTLGV